MYIILYHTVSIAIQTVAQWLVSLNRGVKRGPDSNSNLAQSGQYRGMPPVAGGNNAGRPPRKDANEMSISMESSRSSLGVHQQYQQHQQQQQQAGYGYSLGPTADDLGISRDVSRDRMSLSNNPFTSSGSFNFSNSFSGTGSFTSSSGGVAATAYGGQYPVGHQAAAPHHYQHAPHGSHGALSSAHAMSRQRMAHDIVRGSVPEGDEYADEAFEVDEDEEVHRYDESGYSNYDYKQEEKKSGDHHYYARPSQGGRNHK